MAVPHRLEEGKSASEDARPRRGNVMSHIGWGGEQNTIYKNVETFPSPKRTISSVYLGRYGS